MTVNPKYKDSLFSFLFSDPDVLRELYSALEGIDLPPDVPITINSLKNALYMGIYNDISFEIAGKLVVLLEHQSSINPNMPLRLLMYIARLYEKMYKEKDIYSTKRLSVPRPEFFVLYNGIAPFPDEQIIKLSESYEKLEALGLAEKAIPSLELTVRVININEGKNNEISRRCRKLAEYSAFIAKVRYFIKENDGNKEKAIKKAIKYCLENDILSSFLELYSKEVFNMLSTEWNPKLAKEVWYEEGLEDGLEKGREEGLETGIIKGTQQGKLQSAVNFKKLGVSSEIISQATGLSIEEIEKLW